MPDETVDRREFAASLLPVLEQLPQAQRLVLMRGGIVAGAGDALANVLQSEIAQAETAIAGVQGIEALSGLLGDALIGANRVRLASLRAVLADVAQVQNEHRTQPAAAPLAPTAATPCPRCGNPSSGGLCVGCLSHDRFVEDDRLAHDRSLADRDYQRIQDDYLRDQQTYFDNQDTWRDD